MTGSGHPRHVCMVLHHLLDPRGANARSSREMANDGLPVPALSHPTRIIALLVMSCVSTNSCAVGNRNDFARLVFYRGIDMFFSN